MKKICMVVPNPMVKGGIASVVNGYRGSKLEKDYQVIYVESYKDGGKIAKLMKAISGYLYFAKVLIIDKPDIIHIHSSFGPSFYRKMPFIYMASWAKRLIVNHIHGAEFENFYVNASKKKQKLIRTIYGKCNMLITLSEEWKERLGQIVPAEKIEIIENYSIVNETALEERLTRPCNNTVLFLGELGIRKGCFDIPKIAEKVVTAIPDVKFILAGNGSAEDEEKLKRAFTDNGLEKNVLFPGWIRKQEKDKALRKADIFFLPSYNEGMPMSILDAMGYALPVVSTNVGGIPKIVIDGENGYCCTPGEVQLMAQRIISVLKNDERRLIFARNSVDSIETQYSLEIHITKLESVYSKLEVR